MRVYRGWQRRQVGGSLWSTIQRGIRPILVKLLEKLKPHAIKAGKSLVKKAARSAVNVGMKTLTADNISKDQLKSDIKEEARQWKADAINKARDLKRRFIDQEGSGPARKRRRTQTPKTTKTRRGRPRKAKSKAKSKAKRGRPSTKRRGRPATKRRGRPLKGKRKEYKHKSSKPKKTIRKRRRITVSKKAIQDIFGS